jgi:hypothetical protein
MQSKVKLFGEFNKILFYLHFILKNLKNSISEILNL